MLTLTGGFIGGGGGRLIVGLGRTIAGELAYKLMEIDGVGSILGIPDIFVRNTEFVVSLILR